MKKRPGRPVYSEVRQNMIEIVYFLNRAYGYQIHKIYCEMFKEIDSELIYYHLKKGVSIGEFILVESKEESGEFSWGNKVEKHYYTLGENATPKMDEKVKEYIENK